MVTKMIIRCTKALLKEMSIKNNELSEISCNSKALLGEWYAHLFYILHSKFVIFTHADTLFSFVVSNVRRENIRKMDDLFRKAIAKELYEEDFKGDNISRVIKESQEIHYTKTINRSVLGSMNDLIYQYKYWFSSEDKINLPNKAINRTPMSAINYDFSIERLKSLFPNEIFDRELLLKKYLPKMYAK